MGYYTTYKLEWTPEPNRKVENLCSHRKPAGALFCPQCGIAVGHKGIADIVAKYIESKGDEFGISQDGSSSDGCKWYEHETDMLTMSNEIPDVVFKLLGEGEESGDIWVKYFLNGQYQVCKAAVVIPPFDRTKFKPSKP